MILDTMRPLFIFSFIATLIFATSYWYVSTSGICPVPIAYRLGELDERFNFSAVEATLVLTTAERLWEESVGRDLFVYSDEAEFSINFIYDERQQLASTEEEWRVKLDQEEAKSLRILDQVKAASSDYERAEAEYQADRTRYESRLDSYNNRVEALNQHGGAEAALFEELQTEQKALERVLNQLIDQEKTLNNKADAINVLAEEGNQLVEAYNKEVVRYNEVFGNRDLYTQGDFKRDRINIYKFSDTTELTKVIAHEFGHALGVGHVEGGESLMYYLMAEQPDNLVLSPADTEAFIAICGDGSGLESAVRRIIRTVLSSI